MTYLKRTILRTMATALAVGLGFEMAGGNQAAAQGTWENLAALPFPIGGLAGATTGGKLYVVGSEGTTASTPNFVFIYDPLLGPLGTWSTGLVMPDGGGDARRQTGMGAVAIAGKVYVVGGAEDSNSNSPTGASFVFDPAWPSWASIAPMPTPRVHPAVAAIGGQLYAVGGWSDCGLSCLTYDDLNVYDPGTNTWTTKTPMPTSRERPGAGAIGGKLYVVGGLFRNPDNRAFNAHVIGTLEIYDPATDTWDTSKAPMPTPRVGVAVGVIGGKLHVVGGHRFEVDPILGEITNEYVATHEVYDPVADTWQTLPLMPTARGSMAGAGVIDSKLYVAGGLSLGPVAHDELEVFMPGPDIWVAPTTLDFGDLAAFTSLDLIVTISNTGGEDLTIDEISLSGEASFTATPLVALVDPLVVLAPDATLDVTVTFFPTSEAEYVGTLTVHSDDPDEPIVEVSLIGGGLAGLVEDQATVLEAAVDDAIASGGLVGKGSGKSSNGRLNAFANMIEAAGDLIEAEFIEDACGQLRSALRRVDGESPPPDFVEGDDADLIKAQIIFLLNSLECG